jgi:hypothetical protein
MLFCYQFPRIGKTFPCTLFLSLSGAAQNPPSSAIIIINEVIVWLGTWKNFHNEFFSGDKLLARLLMEKKYHSGFGNEIKSI